MSQADIQNNQPKESFAELLDQSFQEMTSLEGSVVTGTILSIEKDMILIDVGLKSEGRVPIREFGNNDDELNINNKSNNKYELLKVAKKIGIPCVKFYEVSNIIDLEKKLKSFGWPKKRVVIKPPLSNGSRGVRIIDESINLKEMSTCSISIDYSLAGNSSQFRSLKKHEPSE